MSDEILPNDERLDDRADDRDNHLGARGDKDKLKGKMNQVAGKVQEKTGDVIDNKKMQRKGKAKQVKGKLQESAGHVKHAEDDVLHPDR
ncbi:MAG TPA: CsbD family protein [Ktedonobacterales bacterium]|nr:CsbD family protein [Ktedonobacterales bacterium]